MKKHISFLTITVSIVCISIVGCSMNIRGSNSESDIVNMYANKIKEIYEKSEAKPTQDIVSDYASLIKEISEESNIQVIDNMTTAVGNERELLAISLSEFDYYSVALSLRWAIWHVYNYAYTDFVLVSYNYYTCEICVTNSSNSFSCVIIEGGF